MPVEKFKSNKVISFETALSNLMKKPELINKLVDDAKVLNNEFQQAASLVGLDIARLNTVKFMNGIQIDIQAENTHTTRSNEHTDCLGDTGQQCGKTSVSEGCAASEHKSCKPLVAIHNTVELNVEVRFQPIVRQVEFLVNKEVILKKPY